jgi:hypothetical protein
VSIKFTVNNKGTIEHINALKKIPQQLIEDAADYFRNVTPYRSGNARNNTYLGGDTIRADYNYAGRLDDGYSSQAPNGMVEPTIKFIDQRLKKLVEKK